MTKSCGKEKGFFFESYITSSLTMRFKQYKGYENICGFLFTLNELRSLDDKILMSSCTHLEAALNSGEDFDIDGKDLYFKFFGDIIEEMGPIAILKFLKQMRCFPNVLIAYRILLTIYVTIASAERSFSRLKLLKSYLHSTITQERLNGLVTIAIENDVLEKIKYEDIIEEFIFKNSRRMMLFSG
jgi:hypothetical protein